MLPGEVDAIADDDERRRPYYRGAAPSTSTRPRGSQRALRNRILDFPDPRDDADVAIGRKCEGLSAAVRADDHEIAETVQLGVEVYSATDLRAAGASTPTAPSAPPWTARNAR